MPQSYVPRRTQVGCYHNAIVWRNYTTSFRGVARPSSSYRFSVCRPLCVSRVLDTREQETASRSGLSTSRRDLVSAVLLVSALSCPFYICMSLGSRMFGVNVKPSQNSLVDLLRRSGAVKSPRVQDVMRSVDRAYFISDRHAPSDLAYMDHPLPIGGGQTISAPHMHGFALELLEPYLQPGNRALDVGSGSGYLTACIAKMVGPSGYVLGAEKVKDLSERSVNSIKKACPDLADAANWRIVHGNVLSDLLKSEEPFHAIHVGAAADEVPKELVDKLQPGGRMVIPVGPRQAIQIMTIVDKDENGVVSETPLMSVGYVPLTRPGDDPQHDV